MDLPVASPESGAVVVVVVVVETLPRLAGAERVEFVAAAAAAVLELDQ